MRFVTAASAAILAATFGSSALAQAPAQPAAPAAPPRGRPQAQQPMFSTTKVEGTDNVYIFRYQGHQSMFIVTKDGVIATDPIGLYRPQAVKTYIEEIQQDHQGADQIRDLQPPPLRSHRGRQAVQGPRRKIRRAQTRQGAAGRAEISGRGDPRSDRRRQRHDQARRHHARASSTSAATTPTTRW